MPRNLNGKISNNGFAMYDPDGREFYDRHMKSLPPRPRQQGSPRTRYGKCPKDLDEMFGMICAMKDEIANLVEDNAALKFSVNTLQFRNAKLSAELDALDQYSRRENVCFSNIKVDGSNSCEDQVVNLCSELGVDITTEELVAAHPLPGKKGSSQPKSNRTIARFKNRSTAQKVLANRKQSKVIDPAKKKTIFADARKGIAIQPNITPKRAALLAQVKDAVEKCNLDSCWVDPKNCNIMIRVNKSGRPVPIFNTVDLLSVVSDFSPKEFLLCVDPCILVRVSTTDLSPTASPHNIV